MKRARATVTVVLEYDYGCMDDPYEIVEGILKHGTDCQFKSIDVTDVEDVIAADVEDWMTKAHDAAEEELEKGTEK